MTRLLKSLSPYLHYGDFSDIYLEDSSTLSLHWENGQVENITEVGDRGVGLRLIRGLETRYGFTSLSQSASEKLAVADGEKLKVIFNQLKSGFLKAKRPKITFLGSESSALKKNPQDISLEKKVTLLKQAYQRTQRDPHIRQINMNYGEKRKKIGYVNSDGQALWEERIYLVFSIQVTSEKNGERQNAYEAMGGLLGMELFDGPEWKNIVETVCERAIQKLEAPPAPVGEMPVVIAASAGGTLIHEAVGHSLEADAVLEGTSPAYLGRLGNVVANSKLTVFDNPTLPAKRGSFHYDDEGVRAEATKLIENGVLKDYMYDRLSAKRAGRKSNGHGRRESYAHRPIPRMSNTYIAPGPDDPHEILKNFKTGMLVTKMGGGQVNTANGDFVFDVEEGYYVEEGKKTLVRGATLLGNGPEVLMNIDQVGSDHGWGIGTCGKEAQGVPVSDAIPTIHIKKLVIGGQKHL